MEYYFSSTDLAVYFAVSTYEIHKQRHLKSESAQHTVFAAVNHDANTNISTSIATRPASKNSATDTNVAPPPSKLPKLLSSYNRMNTAPLGHERDLTVVEVFNKYVFEQMSNTETTDCLPYWEVKKNEYGKLLPTISGIFPVPASNASIERVFSHGGIFFRLNRARMSDKLLSTLVFLSAIKIFSF